MPEALDAPADDGYDDVVLTDPALTDDGAPAGDAGDGAPADPFAEYGGADYAKQAVEHYRALQTEDGVWNTFFQTGRALGLGVREIEALFNAPGGPGGSQADEPAGPADDDVMTFADFKRIMQEEILQPQAKAAQAQAETMARTVIDTTVEKLGIVDPDIRAAVLQLGDRYLNDDLSPANVAEAVRKGHADYLKVVQAERKAYIAEKRGQQVAVPKAPAGGTGGSTLPPAEDEPRDVNEAIRRARARRAAQG